MLWRPSYSLRSGLFRSATAHETCVPASLTVGGGLSDTPHFRPALIPATFLFSLFPQGRCHMFPAYQLSICFLRIICTRTCLCCRDAALFNIFHPAAATTARHIKKAQKDRVVAQNVI
ncbi:hypothetical protein H4582DRAFT_2011951 [Lactarius indigo]|nr:hypothetical protein H4582DRAFT_2011951 [Lactarius indigo]